MIPSQVQLFLELRYDSVSFSLSNQAAFLAISFPQDNTLYFSRLRVQLNSTNLVLYDNI